MARPRKPTNILSLKGAFKKDPSRLKERENEPENNIPIGSAPDYLDEQESKAFDLIVKESIDGVLGGADRMAVAQAAKLFVICTGQKFDDGDQVKATSNHLNQFFKYLSQFGMTPADRSKINIPKSKPKNKFDD
jgi:phage terminase small subunit